jgi:hypothetical protein
MARVREYALRGVDLGIPAGELVVPLGRQAVENQRCLISCPLHPDDVMLLNSCTWVGVR